MTPTNASAKTPTEQLFKDALEGLRKEGNALIPLFTNKEDDFHFPAVKYQLWYSKALPAVKFLAPDRYSEFCSYYESANNRREVTSSTYTLSDRFKGLGIRNYSEDELRYKAANLFHVQLGILVSVAHRASTIFQDLRGVLDLELKSDELSTAKDLLKVSVRAAGALAGVVLESHLQNVAGRRAVTLKKKKPTISDLNEPLRDALVYDQVTWRKIQVYADIRNLCSHKSTQEPTKEQVLDLIDGVRWLIAHVS